MPEAQLRIRELAPNDRPLSRIDRHGPIVLSDAELISLITGLHSLSPAYQLLARTGGLHGLRRARPVDLVGAVPRLGPVSVARLTAAFDLTRRLLSPDTTPKGMQIRSPTAMAGLCMLEMGDLEQEHLRVISLNTKNVISAITTVYVGSLNCAIVRIGELFREAVRHNSAAVILVHNHPSGDPAPSPEDALVTRQAVEAGKLLDIEVLDHLVIGKGRFVSMRERRLGFAS